MTFDEILDQDITLLQRRGRVTYRTLKRQFQLDDAARDDLTVELITGQRLAVDENGVVRQAHCHRGLGTLYATTDHLAQERGVQRAVRLGCHTGLVVVGEVGCGPRQEQLALGETPNLAARLQSMAAPNTLVISAATY